MVMDLPMLAEDQTGLEVIAAFGAPSAGWTGGIVYRSTDASKWTQMTTVAEGAINGVAKTALTAPLNSPWVWDEVNTVRVVMSQGTPSSADELDVLNGDNVALLGGEIMQWRDATLVSARVYDLSGLLRGRRGTEDQVGTHKVGELFVVLDPYALSSVGMLSTMLGNTVFFKGPTIGGSFDAGDSASLKFTCRCLRCFAPVGISGARAESGDLIITWIRRTRWYGEWLDQVDVPLFEVAEAYSIDILSGSTVKRTLTASSPSVLYSAATQVADFGSAQGAVSVAVYQINAVVGRGIAAKGVV
jgi:hypothetical protein